ncbi:MAG: DUF2304 domain-containing protein [Desulfuromonas sp.]|nr:MAG: DUF2304 domain-containing protein [Desulfuromonas sp.]
MTDNQQAFALIVCAIVFGVTIEMVRTRRLREEYSVLWLLTSCAMFFLVLRYEWLLGLTRLVGAVLPTTTVFLGALVFLLLIVIQFSMKLSRMTDQIKNLAQQNALLQREIEVLKQDGKEQEQGT